jgi:hypothetical protein
MSLNGGEPAFRGISFLSFVKGQNERWESGNPAFGFPLFLAGIAGAVGMWESRLWRFPRAVGNDGKPVSRWLALSDADRRRLS